MGMTRLLIYILMATVASCAQPPMKGHTVKEKPNFSTEITDPQIKVITNEYFRLSDRNDIVFSNKVSIGFSKIDRGSVIGTCSFQRTFREIDLDEGYWARSTWASKVALIYHELTHCYCERGHDFGDGENYPDNTIESIIERILVKQPLTPLKPAGYMDDNCPESIMHPTILDDDCFLKHYQHYTTEMFARCEPF
jgi:hypothetical protein